MTVFFLLMCVGWTARRLGVLQAEFLPKLSALIVSIAGPCLVLTGAIRAQERISADAVGFALAVFMGLIGAQIALGWALPVLLRYTRDMRSTVNFSVWLTNMGYIGMPFVASVFGPQAQVYAMLYLIPHNFILYTYGVWLMRRGTQGTNDTEPGKGAGQVLARLAQMANPGTIAAVVACVLYFGGIALPYVVSEPIVLLGDATAPLSMLLVGAQLVDAKVRELLCDVRLLGFTVLKMIVLPIALLLLLRLFVTDELLLGTCLGIVAMPSGVLVSAFALLYCPKQATYATTIVAFTTLVSVVTIPLVAVVCGI